MPYFIRQGDFVCGTRVMRVSCRVAALGESGYNFISVDPAFKMRQLYHEENAMTLRTVTMQLPENLYLRLQQTSQATRQSFETTVLRALQVGSPPSWETAPAELQADLAALDRLDDAALWRVARSRAVPALMDRYQELLDKNANQTLSTQERAELDQLRSDLDRQMLCKVHAAALLQWRGHQIPPADKL
jgi:hypothetical protein